MMILGDFMRERLGDANTAACLFALVFSTHCYCDTGYIDRAKGFSNLESFLADAMPAMASLADQDDVLNILKEDKDKVQKNLSWVPSKNGALWYARVEKHIASGLVRVCAGYPILVGYGRDGMEALLTGKRKTLTGGVSQGFEVSKEDSFYVWAERDGNQLNFYSIPFPKSLLLEKEVLQRQSDATVLHNIQIESENRNYSAIVDRFAQEVTQQETKKKVNELNQARLEAMQNLERITNEHIASLNRLAEGRTLRATLAGISGLLSLSQLAAQISSWNPDLSNNLSRAQSKDMMLKIFDEGLKRELLNAGTLNQSVMNQSTKLDAEKKKLNSTLMENGVPIDIIPE